MGGSYEAIRSEESAATEARPVVELDNASFCLVYLGLALCLFAVAEENIMLANAQKAMVAELGHQELVPWLTTAFSFTAAGFNQLYGSFATVFDRKWVLVTATTFYATGALIVGLSHSMSTVIVGRCIQGVGRGGLFSMVLVIIADIVTPKYRAIFQGVVGAMFALSAFLAPFFASAFVDAGQWRWCFLFVVPLASSGILLIVIFLKPNPREGNVLEKLKRIDYMGTALLLAAIGTLITAIQQGGVAWSWSSGSSIALFVLSPLLFMAFVFWEMTFASNPMLPMDLFMNRNIVALAAVGFLLGWIYDSGIAYISTFLQIQFNENAKTAAVQGMSRLVGSFTVSIISGILIVMTGYFSPYMVLGPLLFTINSIMTAFLAKDASTALIIFSLFFFGAGAGCLNHNRIVGMQASVPFSLLPIVTSLGYTAQLLGSAVGTSISGAIFNGVLANNVAANANLTLTLANLSKALHVVPPLDALQSIKTFTYLGTVRNATLAGSVTAAREGVLETYRGAFETMFLALVPVAAVALLAGLFVRDLKVAGGRNVTSYGWWQTLFGWRRKEAGAERQEEEGGVRSPVPMDGEFVVSR